MAAHVESIAGAVARFRRLALPTTHPQTTHILDTDLDALLLSGQTGRITLTIGTGGNVRIEVAKFRDVAKEESRQ